MSSNQEKKNIILSLKIELKYLKNYKFFIIIIILLLLLQMNFLWGRM